MKHKQIKFPCLSTAKRTAVFSPIAENDFAILEVTYKSHEKCFTVWRFETKAHLIPCGSYSFAFEGYESAKTKFIEITNNAVKRIIDTYCEEE